VSIQVQVGELADAMAVYRFAYLVTISDDGRAHVVAVTPRWDGRALIVEGLGRRSAANLAARPAVTLVWPPLEPQGYSLILDGEVSGDAAAADDPEGRTAGDAAGTGDGAAAAVTIVPGRAVLHRPAPGVGQETGSGELASGAGGSGCTSDCVDLDLGKA
jgi:hypothetical protein